MADDTKRELVILAARIKRLALQVIDAPLDPAKAMEASVHLTRAETIFEDAIATMGEVEHVD